MGQVLSGYDKDGYDKEGFDKIGYDRSGFDKNGFDKRNGVNVIRFLAKPMSYLKRGRT